MIPPVRFRKREEISEIVDTIFAKHHPSREIPVPVDLIAERMGLDLVPIPGFRARAGAEGALSTDRSTIYYDERGAELHAARYRFTVAHELAQVPQLGVPGVFSDPRFGLFPPEFPGFWMGKVRI